MMEIQFAPSRALCASIRTLRKAQGRSLLAVSFALADGGWPIHECNLARLERGQVGHVPLACFWHLARVLGSRALYEAARQEIAAESTPWQAGA